MGPLISQEEMGRVEKSGSLPSQQNKSMLEEPISAPTVHSSFFARELANLEAFYGDNEL